MLDRIYYVICADGCKFESMTKEQILAAIAEATGATVTDIDAAFISKVKNQKDGGVIKLWRGTSAEYNALSEVDPDCFYIITDDTTNADINARIEEMDAAVEAVEKKFDEQAKTIEGTLSVFNNAEKKVGTLNYIKSGNVMQVYGSYAFGFNADGDADTVNLVDNNGEFVKPNTQWFNVTIMGSGENDGSLAAGLRFSKNDMSCYITAYGVDTSDGYSADINITYLI